MAGWKVGETPQNKRCEEVLKLYVWVSKGFLEQFNNAHPKSINWNPVISQLYPQLELVFTPSS
jgi:hypothetical protein